MSATKERIYRFATGSELRDSVYTPPQSRVQQVANAENVGICSSAPPCGMPRFRNPAETLKARRSLPLATVTNSRQGDPKDSAQTESTLCSCQRPACIVKCTSCGHHFSGRVRLRCPIHPSQIFLMDNEVCPSCSASSLTEYPKDGH